MRRAVLILLLFLIGCGTPRVEARQTITSGELVVDVYLIDGQGFPRLGEIQESLEHTIPQLEYATGLTVRYRNMQYVDFVYPSQFEMGPAYLEQITQFLFKRGELSGDSIKLFLVPPLEGRFKAGWARGTRS